MAVQLDEIDVRLLKELETDADRPNVELARIVEPQRGRMPGVGPAQQLLAGVIGDACGGHVIPGREGALDQCRVGPAQQAAGIV